MSKKFFCLSILLPAVLLVIAPVPAQANLFSKVFMPGQLSLGHVKYEDDCHHCHSSFSKNASQRKLCLDCHKKVAKDLDDKTGFHGRNNRIGKTECNHCHTEHKGRKFNIMLFDQDLFSHKITDFLLKGGHRKVNCINCHPEKTKYRGAPQVCFNCHEKDDYHNGNLGEKCEECHDETSWSKFQFDHSLTKYPLTGRHKKGACLGCHPGRKYKGIPKKCYECHTVNDVHGGSYSKNCVECHTPSDWKKSTFTHKKLPSSGNLKSSDCVSCHKTSDVHKGKFGTNCKDCHESKKWKAVIFDHAKTEFKLEGKHVNVDCDSCHIGPIPEKKTPMECIDCHQARDEHNGLFGKKCKTCHTVKEWKGPVFDHDKTSFKLTEKHLKVACSLCHKGNLYKDLPDNGCVGCHKFDDPHESLYATVCAPCHTAKAWDDPIFDHEKSVLSGTASKEVRACPLCYEQRLGQDCYGCHRSQDIHKGKEGKKCESCHNTDGWGKKIFFEHDMTSFPLLGMHAVALCEGCHLDQEFKGAATECVKCHEKDDEHKGGMGKKCISCHNPNGWSYWIFDHSEKTKFPLNGAHTELECVPCHKKPITGDVSQARTCHDCHKKDSTHTGRFWRKCVQCHTTKSFKEMSKEK